MNHVTLFARQKCEHGKPGAVEGLLSLLQQPSEGLWPTILRRKHCQRRALLQLAGQWDRLSTTQRLTVLDTGREDLVAAVHRQAADISGLALAQLIDDLRDSRLARELVRILLGNDAVAADAAERAMIGLASAGEASARGSPIGQHLRYARSSELHEAIATLVVTFPEHRRRGVFAAALAMMSPSVLAFAKITRNPLAHWFHGGDPASHMVLRSELKSAESEISRKRAWEWLGCAQLGAAAIERLCKGGSLVEHQAVLELGHLAAVPRRQRRLHGCGRGVRRRLPVPGPGSIPGMTMAARRGYAAILPHLGLSVEERVRRLQPLLADSGEEVRFAAIQSLPHREVLDFCFDRSEPIARSAALRLSLSESGSARDWNILSRAPHAAVRAIARQQVAAAGAVSARSTLAEYREAAADRRRWVSRIRQQLGGSNPAWQFQAVVLLQRMGMGLAAECELELLTLVGRLSSQGAIADDLKPSEAMRLLATVAVLLGQLGTNSSQDALQALLHHSAPRVRANAAEAIIRQSRRRGDVLDDRIIELKNDPGHRVAASVLKAMLVESTVDSLRHDAQQRLGAMLCDELPLRRLAALWAVERAAASITSDTGRAGGLDQLAPVVADLARSDPEEAVRRRAVQCAARLLLTLRGRWGRRAAQISPGAQNRFASAPAGTMQ